MTREEFDTLLVDYAANHKTMLDHRRQILSAMTDPEKGKAFIERARASGVPGIETGIKTAESIATINDPQSTDEQKTQAMESVVKLIMGYKEGSQG